MLSFILIVTKNSNYLEIQISLLKTKRINPKLKKVNLKSL